MARNEIILKSKLSRSESSGLSMRQIASELITQGESLVRIIGSDED